MPGLLLYRPVVRQSDVADLSWTFTIVGASDHVRLCQGLRVQPMGEIGVGWIFTLSWIGMDPIFVVELTHNKRESVNVIIVT